MSMCWCECLYTRMCGKSMFPYMHTGIRGCYILGAGVTGVFARCSALLHLLSEQQVPLAAGPSRFMFCLRQGLSLNLEVTGQLALLASKSVGSSVHHLPSTERNQSFIATTSFLWGGGWIPMQVLTRVKEAIYSLSSLFSSQVPLRLSHKASLIRLLKLC